MVQLMWLDEERLTTEKPVKRNCAVLGLVTQSCPALCAPWTVAHQAPLSMEILQARILEWVAMPSSRASSQPRDRTQVSGIAGGFITIWATKKIIIRVNIYHVF